MAIYKVVKRRPWCVVGGRLTPKYRIASPMCFHKKKEADDYARKLNKGRR